MARCKMKRRFYVGITSVLHRCAERDATLRLKARDLSIFGKKDAEGGASV